MKVNSELSFHYHLRKEQNKKSNGLVPIYCRISLNGRRGNFSTRLFAPQDMWSKDVEQVKVKYPEADRINKELMVIASKISKAYQDAFQQNGAVSLDDFKFLVFNEDKAVKGEGRPEINPELDKLISRYMNDLNDKFKSKIIAKGTYKNYKSSLTKFQEFFDLYYKTKRFRLKDLNKQIFFAFESFLQQNQHHSRNYTYKVMKNIRRLFNYSYEVGWIEEKPHVSLSVTYRNPKREIMTLEEIKALDALEIENATLRDARDCAIFQCYTGLAYSEIFALTSENIRTKYDKKWVVISRKKTGIESNLVLLPMALKVLERNQNNPYCLKHNKLLPIRSNADYNRTLKVLQKMCSIHYNVNSHSLRHTFSTTVALSLGLPMETLSTVLGHTNLRTTMIYGKILDTKINDDFDKLAERLKEV
jgi:site-specific recombinase XerD